jgi:hypothetical protein
MVALGRAVESREGEDELAGAAHDILVLKQRVQDAVRLRPWLLVWRGLDDLVRRVEGVAAAFLRAIEASTPIDGQRWAKAGQEGLDAAGDEAAELGRRLSTKSPVHPRGTSSSSTPQAVLSMNDSQVTLTAHPDWGRDYA